jgi:hypothetical protein
MSNDLKEREDSRKNTAKELGVARGAPPHPPPPSPPPPLPCPPLPSPPAPAVRQACHAATATSCTHCQPARVWPVITPSLVPPPP